MLPVHQAIAASDKHLHTVPPTAHGPMVAGFQHARGDVMVMVWRRRRSGGKGGGEGER